METRSRKMRGDPECKLLKLLWLVTSDRKPLFFCRDGVCPHPICHFYLDPTAPGNESQGAVVEIYPLRNGTPPDEQVTSLVAFYFITLISLTGDPACRHSAFVGDWSYFVLCHHTGSEKHSNHNVKMCRNTELLCTNQRKYLKHFDLCLYLC